MSKTLDAATVAELRGTMAAAICEYGACFVCEDDWGIAGELFGEERPLVQLDRLLQAIAATDEFGHPGMHAEEQTASYFLADDAPKRALSEVVEWWQGWCESMERGGEDARAAHYAAEAAKARKLLELLNARRKVAA